MMSNFQRLSNSVISTKCQQRKTENTENFMKTLKMNKAEDKRFQKRHVRIHNFLQQNIDNANSEKQLTRSKNTIFLKSNSCSTNYRLMQNTTKNVSDHRALCRVKAVPQWWLDAGRFVREFPQLFRANYDLFVSNCPEIICSLFI